MSEEQQKQAHHNSKISHAQRRFLKHISAFQDALGQVGGDYRDPSTLLAHQLYRKGGRTPCFALQGLARVYRKLDIDEAFFDKLRLEVKIVEDKLGAVDFWWVTANKAKQFSLPQSIVTWAQEQHIAASGAAWAWLEARGWVQHRYQEEAELCTAYFTRKLKKVDWLSPKKEHKALGKWLVEELYKTHEGIQALNLDALEEGLHETRRQIRWFSVYAGALEGGIVLNTEAKAPENWSTYMQKEIVENPFNKLAAPEDGDRPISLDAPLFYALSYLIDRIGILKDRAQWVETFQHGIKETGTKLETSLQDAMGEHFLSPEDACQQGKALVQKTLFEDKLLLRFADNILDQL